MMSSEPLRVPIEILPLFYSLYLPNGKLYSRCGYCKKTFINFNDNLLRPYCLCEKRTGKIVCQECYGYQQEKEAAKKRESEGTNTKTLFWE